MTFIPLILAGAVSVVECGGVPRIAVDGIPVSGTAVIPSPKTPLGKTADSLRSFGDCGIRFLSNVWTMSNPNYAVRQWWLGEGRYNWPLFDALARGPLGATADGYIFPRIKLDPPKSWLDAHPEEVSVGEVRADSKAWKALYRRMLKDMVDHVESSDYADRVIGYHIGALHCAEWGIWPVDILPPAECKADEPFPAAEKTLARRRRIDEYNDAVAEAVIDSARVLRGLTKERKLIGSFFGYVAFSHQSMAKVFRSGLIDFYAAPPLYGEDREVGHDGCSQALYWSSYRLHNAVFYEESDFRTFLSDPLCAPIEMTRRRPLDESVAIMRRSIGKCLALGYENWWFLLGGEKSYSHPLLMGTIARGAAVARETMRTAKWTPAEVAVFTSADEYATSYGTHATAFGLACKLRQHADILPACGVPYDSYELNDIFHPGLPDYRVYYFPNAFTLTEAQRARILSVVRRAGKTAVWLCAPGYYRNGKGGQANVQELVDPNAAADVGARSVLLKDPPDATALRNVFRDAGAHVWSDSGDVLHAGRGFVMLHAASDGQKQVRLPMPADAVEIFGASRAQTNVSVLAETLCRGETRVYRLSPASRKLRD